MIKYAAMGKLSCWFVTLALAVLLLVCVGCQEDAQVTDHPSPRDMPSAATEPQPTPEVTSSETSYPPNPDPPASVFLTVDTGIFTITNAEGQTITHEEEISGTMDILQMNEIMEVKMGRMGFTMWVPYSGHFLYERVEPLDEDGLWHIAVTGFPHNSFRQYFAVEGGGLGGSSAERVEYDASGSLLVCGEPGGLGLTLATPDSPGLGETGWIKLTVRAAQEELRLESQGNTVTFSGLEPGFAMLSYGGNTFASNVYLDLEVGSGTLDFSQVAEQQITLQEDGRESRILTTSISDLP